MSLLSHRIPAIETLQRMTSRLADPGLTIDEASLLRSSIHQLMDAISAAGPDRDRIVWPEEGHANLLVGPVATAGESTGSFRADWREVSPARTSG